MGKFAGTKARKAAVHQTTAKVASRPQKTICLEVAIAGQTIPGGTPKRTPFPVKGSLLVLEGQGLGERLLRPGTVSVSGCDYKPTKAFV